MLCWKKIMVCVIALAILMGAGPTKAYAYIDPGTGSFFLQILLAFIFGALFTIKMWWRRTLSFSKSIFSRKKDKA